MTELSPALRVPSASECRWDCVSLGEVMLRFDPGDERIHTTRNFRVWEGGGEYNVARALRRTFDLRTSIVTALVDNEIGRLVEDLMLQGGVALDHVRWMPHDGVGETARNGIYFFERGYGVRAGRGCYDRAHTAVAQLRPGDIDWRLIFEREATRWFHTGGVFAGLSETAPAVAREAMIAARAAGAIVSYDANYRALLWQRRGGREQARRVNRELARHADVLFGSVEDFLTSPEDEAGNDGDRRDGMARVPTDLSMFERLCEELPNVSVVATTRRDVRSANVNRWQGVLYAAGELHCSAARELEVYDRVGGGDAFAAGVIYSLLDARPAHEAAECGAAIGALAMTTRGDHSSATLTEVERLMRGGDARALR